MPTDTTARTAIPPIALWLGLAGLLPFIGAAIAVWLSDTEQQPQAVFALLAYGAVILSFLGGVRWGAVLRNQAALEQAHPLVMSILPSLVAWLALLVPPTAGLTLLIIGLSGQFLYDRAAARSDELPAWYGRLRVILSIGAVTSLAVALVGISTRGIV